MSDWQAVVVMAVLFLASAACLIAAWRFCNNAQALLDAAAQHRREAREVLADARAYLDG